METLDEFPPGEKCVFCRKWLVDELKFGRILKYEKIVCHYFCLLFSAEVEQKGSDDDGILGFLPQDIEKEIKRGEKIPCTYCQAFGATITCSTRNCKKKFHYMCGVDNGSLHQFFDNFKSFCHVHKRRQTVVPPTDDESIEKQICLICYDEVQDRPTLHTIWAPCCKTAWFHRICIQKMALNGGYFFRCPKCNNNEEFRKEMWECGIYIPDQDASWELEPHAFEELAQRYSNCDADICSCPEGRSHRSTGLWEIVLCTYCGSQGTHRKCCRGRTNEFGKFECPTCASEETRPLIRRNCRFGRRKRIGSNEATEVSGVKKRAVNSLSDDSDSASATGVVECNTAYLLDDSDENESDVESSMRSTARLQNEPLIMRPNSLVQASSLNSAVIDLDSDDDSNVHNEVTSESVDDTILEDDDDVVFISYDKLNEKTDDDLPPPTALLRFVENNTAYIVSPADVKRKGGIEKLAASFNPSVSATESTNAPSTNTPMWQPVPLHKSIIHSLAASQLSEDISNTYIDEKNPRNGNS
ncbi:hypothetical protein V9T40_000864 [Parthenolecanium corni]|uniref:G2/M phase-specific E3 ubiquitin-protein ligase n=1 Tax=Parthenolecanium corni TaxID=536013 RepID=A0AAN9TCF2_9HEMI